MNQILKPKEPINEDPISYLIDLIIRLSKILTKGRGLSRNGVKALLLFLLTAGLLYGNTNMPTKTFDILKLYWVPLIFMVYFLADLGRNIDRVNNFFKKLSQKTDYIYETIMGGTINHVDLELYLMTLPFSYDQIVDIIHKLVHDGQFTSGAQTNLLHNNVIYRIDTFPLIEKSFIESVTLKDSMVDIEWTSSAVCVFLKKTSGNLPIKYLDKIIEKYKKYPSILVAIGFFHRYRIDAEDDNIATYFKIGYEFKNSKLWSNVANYLFLLVFTIFVLFLLTAVPLFPSKSESIVFYQMGLGVLVAVLFYIQLYVSKNQFNWSIRNHLRNYEIIEDDCISEKIAKDVHCVVNIEQ